MSRPRLIGVVALAALLAGAHWLYWYAPAERVGRPDADSLAGRIFLGGDLPYRLWLPYPHQNLARLEAAIGPLDSLLERLARLRGDAAVRELPGFGGLRLPPSKALAVATDETGDELLVAAQVYPLVGLLSRWAGRLAGNPLLAGGRTEVGGRQVEVRWEGPTWLLLPTDVALPSSESQAGRGLSGSGALVEEGALAWLRLESPRGVLPAGEYRLERRGRDLELLGGDASRLEVLDDLAAGRPPLPLVRLEGRGGAERSWRVFGLVPGLESLGGLPGAVAVHCGSEPFALPGERIAEAIGDGVRVRRSDRWEIRALDRRSLERGSELARFATALEPHLPLELGLWLELRSAERLTEQVVDALEAVPVIGRREARHWHVARLLLAQLDGFERLTVLVSPAPVAVRARLWRPAVEIEN